MMLFSDKQKEYCKHCNHRWNFKSGATRSGKSYLDLTYIIPMRIRERIGLDGLVVILGVTKETIERNILSPMRDKYGEEVVGTINNRNQCYLFGEVCYCLGAEKISQVSKLRGASFKYVYGDEVADWNKEVFELLKSRLDKEYSCFDGALNPQFPTHWLKEFLDSDADIYLQEYTIFDNPFLPKEFVENLCKEYEGTIYYDRYILGKWKRAEGAIYRRFSDNPKAFECKVINDKQKEEISVKCFKTSDLEEITIGLDFGGTKSGHAFVACGKTKDYEELIVLKSERHFGEYAPKDLDNLFIKFCQSVLDKYGHIDYVYWDNAESVLGRGITKAVNDFNKDTIVRPARKERIKNRIDGTLRLMGMSRFYVVLEECETIKKALSECVWNSQKEDERLDDGTTDIDSLDALEYTFERDLKKFIVMEE